MLSLAPQPGARLLVDIDGTLLDTHALLFLAVNVVFAPFGHHFDRARYTAEVQGFANAASIGEQRLLAGQSERPARNHGRQGRRPSGGFGARADSKLPGLIELMAAADRAGLPMAAVTNAPRLNAEMLLDALGIRARFKAIVICEELARGKPHPLPYLEGLRLLGARAERSVAFEDSRSGLTSAIRAGLPTVALLTSLNAAEAKAAGASVAAGEFCRGRACSTSWRKPFPP